MFYLSDFVNFRHADELIFGLLSLKNNIFTCDVKIKNKCLTCVYLFQGSARNLPMNGSPEPPPPPPRNHDNSFNESKDSNEISEAECDRDQLVNRNYGGRVEDDYDSP